MTKKRRFRFKINIDDIVVYILLIITIIIWSNDEGCFDQEFEFFEIGKPYSKSHYLHDTIINGFDFEVYHSSSYDDYSRLKSIGLSLDDKYPFGTVDYYTVGNLCKTAHFIVWDTSMFAPIKKFDPNFDINELNSGETFLNEYFNFNDSIGKSIETSIYLNIHLVKETKHNLSFEFSFHDPNIIVDTCFLLFNDPIDQNVEHNIFSNQNIAPLELPRNVLRNDSIKLKGCGIIQGVSKSDPTRRAAQAFYIDRIHNINYINYYNHSD